MSISNFINPRTGHFLECMCEKCDRDRARQYQRFCEEDEYEYLREFDLMATDPEEMTPEEWEEYWQNYHDKYEGEMP